MYLIKKNILHYYRYRSCRDSTEDWVLSMRHANASPSYNARASRMRMRGLSKSANRTSRLIYGFCKPCTVIGLSRGWSEANRRTKCEIIQERQIEFRRAYISSRLDFKISSAAIIISTRRLERCNAQTFSDCFDIFSYKAIHFRSL